MYPRFNSEMIFPLPKFCPKLSFRIIKKKWFASRVETDKDVAYLGYNASADRRRCSTFYDMEVVAYFNVDAQHYIIVIMLSAIKYILNFHITIQSDLQFQVFLKFFSNLTLTSEY